MKLAEPRVPSPRPHIDNAWVPAWTERSAARLTRFFAQIPRFPTLEEEDD